MNIEWLEAEIDRLRALPHAEVGVPMFLIPEDLGSSRPAPRTTPGGEALSRAFDEAVALLEAKRGPLSARDLAAIVEVLAEHNMLDRPFSSLADDAAR